MASTKNQVRGVVLIIVSSFMFASYGVWAKLIGNNFGVFFQGWSRGLIIASALLPILLYTKQLIPIQRKDWGWMGVFVLSTSLTQAPLFYAFTQMSIASAMLLFFVAFLLTMYAVGTIFLGEKLTPIKLISFMLGIAGLYLVFSFSLAVFTLLAAAMAILNGIASGSEISFSKKISDRYSTLYLSWISWTAIAIINAPISFWLGETQHIPSWDAVWLYQACYTAASVLGFWLVMEGLRYVEASIGGLLSLLEVVLAILFGMLFFNEELSVKEITGAGLILLAAALPHLYALHKQRAAAVT